MKACSNLFVGLASGGVSLLLVATAAWLAPRMKIDASGQSVSRTIAPSLVISEGAGATATLMETAVLFGPASLFLPTEWTASEVALPSGVRRVPGATFPSVQPRWFQEESALKSPLANPLPMPSDGLEVLAMSKTPASFRTFGALDANLTPLAKRSLHLEAMEVAEGKLLLAMPLTLKDGPAELNSDWKPMEMLVAVTPSGQVGLPAIVQGTGSDLLDRFLLDYFTHQLPISLGLKPGFYTLRIGP